VREWALGCLVSATVGLTSHRALTLSESLDDDPLAGLQPLLDDPEGADSLADLNRRTSTVSVGPDHGDLMDVLQVLHGALRNEERVLRRSIGGAHLHELPAAEARPGSGTSSEVDGCRLLPILAVEDHGRPRCGYVVPSARMIPRSRNPLRGPPRLLSQILLLADGDLDVIGSSGRPW